MFELDVMKEWKEGGRADWNSRAPVATVDKSIQ